MSNPSYEDALGRIEELEAAVESALRWLEHAPVDYRNGIVAPNGVDEGNVRGWEWHRKLANELRVVLGKEPVDYEAYLRDVGSGDSDGLPF
jgi:hypothetical protein